MLIAIASCIIENLATSSGSTLNKPDAEISKPRQSIIRTVSGDVPILKTCCSFGQNQ